MRGEARKLLLIALALMTVSSGYYLVCAATLPGGAGPDEVVSLEAVHFLYEHRRLAVLPEDEDLLHFSPTGSTRALRPPLAFITAAIVGGPFADVVANHVLLSRLGSVVLCALGVVITWLFAWTLLRSHAWALAGALLLALLPQYAFIASYANDDSAAIASAALLYLSMALIHRNGVDLKHSALLGLAVGGLVIAKPTAWLLAPTAALFVLLFVRASARRLATCALVAALAFMLGGGWWLVHNVRHYGWQDPTARAVQAEVGARHRRVDDTVLQSFRDRDIGYRALLLGNAEHFWQRTMRSSIGHLGWLELRLGSFQYVFYMLVIVLALAYVPARVGAAVVRGRGGASDAAVDDGSRLRFELLLLFSIAFQFAVYVWRNETTEVQLQGKYLLPVAPAVIALFLLGLRSGVNAALGWFQRRGVNELCLPVNRIAALVIGCVIAIAFIAHAHALWAYVFPYYGLAGYKPPLKIITFPSTQIWHPPGNPVAATNEVEDLMVSHGEMSFRSTGSDPWLLLDGSLCDMISGNTLLAIDLTASEPGTFAVYWDEGDGTTERKRVKADYPAGRSGVLLGIATQACDRLRLDPAHAPARITIHRIQVAGFRVSDP